MTARISPICSAFIIVGIIMLGAVPPLGVALLVIAFFIQRSYRRSALEVRDERYQKALEKHRREKTLAAKAFRT